jgi:putative cardiolipin synthase
VETVGGSRSVVDLVVVSPYLVPGEPGMKLLSELRARGVNVRILTNSLASTDMPIVHAGYRHYRVPLLQMGVELYEVRRHPGEPESPRGLIKSASSGAFALHAKVILFDRERAFVGSMNFDRRSLRINTGAGIDHRKPPDRGRLPSASTRSRSPANSYRLMLSSSESAASLGLRWVGVKDGNAVSSTPSRASSH